MAIDEPSANQSITAAGNRAYNTRYTIFYELPEGINNVDRRCLTSNFYVKQGILLLMQNPHNAFRRNELTMEELTSGEVTIA